MTEHERRHGKQDILGLASFGFFLVLVGVIWIITPNLLEEVRDFFNDFKLEEAFPNVFLPAPATPHPVVYTAIARFCFGLGIFQIFILFLRFVFREPVDKLAGTFSGIVFWLGAGFVANTLSAGTIKWFVFIGWIIVLIGLTLVIRSLVILLFELVLRKSWSPYGSQTFHLLPRTSISLCCPAPVNSQRYGLSPLRVRMFSASRR